MSWTMEWWYQRISVNLVRNVVTTGTMAGPPQI